MRYAVAIVVATLALAGRAVADEPVAAGAEFKLASAVTADGKTLEVAVYVSDHYAVEFDPEDDAKVAAVYDLDAKCWRDNEQGVTVRWEACQRWADTSRERTKRSLQQQSDPEFVRFIEASLDPKFQVSEEKGVVVLTNNVLTYRLSDAISVDEAIFNRSLQYDRLNAYRKAMVDRKFPPNAQLAVDAELESRKFLPSKMELTIKVKGRVIKLDVRNRIVDLSAEEKVRVAAAIQAAAPKLSAGSK